LLHRTTPAPTHRPDRTSGTHQACPPHNLHPAWLIDGDDDETEKQDVEEQEV
jgi:hypothetical protein